MRTTENKPNRKIYEAKEDIRQRTKATEVQLSSNEVSNQVTKNSKSYLLGPTRITVQTGKKGHESASKRPQVKNPNGERRISNRAQINSTENMQRINDRNHYLYEGGARLTAEEWRVVTKLAKLAANRSDASQAKAKLSNQEAKNQSLSVKHSKEISILSIIPATAKKGPGQFAQDEIEEPAVQQMRSIEENQHDDSQLSIKEVCRSIIDTNLFRDSEVKSASDEREIHILSKQHESELSEESKMEQDNKSIAKFTNTEAMNRKDNTSTPYLLKDENPQIKIISAIPVLSANASKKCKSATAINFMSDNISATNAIMMVVSIIV